MSQKFNLYVGKAGQLAAMAEFLMRGWNAAMPEVDSGDDIFVVEDMDSTFFRVQVKTAQAIVRQNNYSAQFNIPLRQLETPNPIMYFVFLIRKADTWVDILLIQQNRLYDMVINQNIGTIHKQNVVLYLSVENNKVTCSKTDFTSFRNNYEDFPIATL